MSQGAITNSAENGNSTGISGGVGTSTVSCSAADNAQIGISFNDCGSIIVCTVFNNLRCADGCLVRECDAFSTNNGDMQAGIRATGSNNRLDGNNATGAPVGLDIDGIGNAMRGNNAGTLPTSIPLLLATSAV